MLWYLDYGIWTHTHIYTYIYPRQEYQLVRIFDSMSFEDECEDNLQIGIRAEGDLDHNQTRQVMCLGQVKNARMSSWSYSLKKASKKYRTLALLRQIAAGGEIERLQSLGTSLSNAGPSMGTAGSPGETPTTQNTPKEKKKPPLQKQIGSKIAASTSKLAEIMAWESKVNEVPNMYLNFIKWFWKFIDLLIGSMLCTILSVEINASSQGQRHCLMGSWGSSATVRAISTV